MSRPFEARYRGRCAGCDEWFAEGALVRFDDQQIVHDDCSAAEPIERKVQPMCPRCFTELPISGDCGMCA